MMVKHRRPRVLLLAEACNPEWASVPPSAYYWYRARLERGDVTLVTRVRNKAGFAHCVDSNDVVFVDSELIVSPLHKLGRSLTLDHPTALGKGHRLASRVFPHAPPSVSPDGELPALISDPKASTVPDPNALLRRSHGSGSPGGEAPSSKLPFTTFCHR